MKIRHGFVSNSSSTSFCVYGYALDTHSAKFTKDEATVKFWIERLWDKCYTNHKMTDELEQPLESMLSTLRDLLFDPPMGERGNSDWDENIYVGFVGGGGGDPMTSNEELHKARELWQISDDEKPSWHKDCWRDG